MHHLAIRLDECNADSCAPSCAQSLARYKVAIVAQQRHMQLGTHKYPPTPLQRLQNVTNCWKTTRQEVQGLATQISVCFFRPIYQPSTRGPSKFGQVLMIVCALNSLNIEAITIFDVCRILDILV